MIDEKELGEISSPEPIGYGVDDTVFNTYSSLPVGEFDYVYWKNKQMPLDVVIGKAFVALKVGGVLFLDNIPEVEQWKSYLETMFTLVHKDRSTLRYQKDAK